jgi:MFS family permease
MTGPGQTIGVSVFVDPMIDDLGLTRSELSTAYLIGTLLGALTLPTIGHWIDRVGARRAMTLIGLGFGTALVAMSGVQGFVTLAAGFTLIRLLGQGSLSLVSAVSIMHWFRRRRGLVFGVVMTLMNALMSLTPIGLNLAIEAYSWRTAWLLSGITVLLVVVPMAYFGIVNRPEDVGQHVDGEEAPPDGSTTESVPESHSRREALGQVRFWLLSMTVATTSLLITALIFHQISILGEVGLSATQAAAMFLPHVAGAILTGLVAGALLDRLPTRFVLTFSMVLTASALLMVGAIEQGWRVVAYAVVLGAAAGVQRPLAATVLPRWFGPANIGAIQGVASFVAVSASAVGPIALSLARTWTGGYSSAALVFGVMPLILGIASLTISDPDRPLPVGH